jgi:DNA-binding NtrC family response regulator
MDNASPVFRDHQEDTSTFRAESTAEGMQLLTVVVVSADPDVRAAMTDVLQECCLKTILVDGLTELRSIPSEEMVVACLCGYWLADGTVPEVAAYLKQQPIEVPLIMVSEPAPTREYEDFLDSLSIGAFDFVCHPYSIGDIQLIVWSAIQSYCELAQSRLDRLNEYRDLTNGSAFRDEILH